MDEMREVEVLANEGRHIPGYGSRQKGEVFALPEKMAKEITKQQPGAFKLLKAKKATDEEVDDNAN